MQSGEADDSNRIALNRARHRLRKHALLACLVCIIVGPSCSLLWSADELSSATSPALDSGSVDGRSELDVGSFDATDTGPEGGTRYRDVILGDDPAAYWRLGEAADDSTVHDETGHGNDGIYVLKSGRRKGALSPADDDGALDLDAGGWADLGSRFDFDGTKPFTLEAWISPRTLEAGTNRHVLTKQDRTSPETKRGPALLVRDVVAFERYVDGGGNALVAPVAVNTWSHIMAVYDGSRMRLFVNGSEAAAPKMDTRSAAPHGMSFLIGAATSVCPASCFNGGIDEVAVYDRALAPERARAHFDARTK